MLARAMTPFHGKLVLITGATGGLGSWVTQAFLDAGATVAGVSRSIRDSDFPGPRFHAIPAELSTGDAARAAVEETLRRLERIDALVHLVGGFAGGTSVAETSDETFDRMMDLNLRSAFFTTRAVVPHMRERGSGRLLAIGSRAAVDPRAGLCAYNASKAALVALMRTLAFENKDRDITSNVILPGAMDTPQNRAAQPAADHSRWVPPSRVADLLVWLASPEAASVNGAVIPMYGAEL